MEVQERTKTNNQGRTKISERAENVQDHLHEKVEVVPGIIQKKRHTKGRIEVEHPTNIPRKEMAIIPTKIITENIRIPITTNQNDLLQ